MPLPVRQRVIQDARIASAALALAACEAGERARDAEGSASDEIILTDPRVVDLKAAAISEWEDVANSDATELLGGFASAFAPSRLREAAALFSAYGALVMTAAADGSRTLTQSRQGTIAEMKARLALAHEIAALSPQANMFERVIHTNAADLIGDAEQYISF